MYVNISYVSLDSRCDQSCFVAGLYFEVTECLFVCKVIYFVCCLELSCCKTSAVLQYCFRTIRLGGRRELTL